MGEWCALKLVGHGAVELGLIINSFLIHFDQRLFEHFFLRIGAQPFVDTRRLDIVAL